MLEPSLRKENLSFSRNDRKRSLRVCLLFWLFVCLFCFLGIGLKVKVNCSSVLISVRQISIAYCYAYETCPRRLPLVFLT